jgi:hypothetical protein
VARRAGATDRPLTPDVQIVGAWSLKVFAPARKAVEVACGRWSAPWLLHLAAAPNDGPLMSGHEIVGLSASASA